MRREDDPYKGIMVLLPFPHQWAERERSRWIVDNQDDLERIYTRLWQEITSTLGKKQAMMLDIRDFSRFLESRIKEV